MFELGEIVFDTITQTKVQILSKSVVWDYVSYKVYNLSNNEVYKVAEDKLRKEFPNTTEYFRYAKKKTGRLKALCKTCDTKKNQEKNERLRQKNANLNYTNLFYDGERICKKCQRSLPNNFLYFPADKVCKDGLRHVCRECDPSYKNFLSEDYTPLQKWTKEEDDILRQVYKDYTGEQIQKQFLSNRSVRAIESRADILGILGKSEIGKQATHKQQSEKLTGMFIGRVMSEETKAKWSQAIREYYKTHHGAWLGRKRSPEQCKQISERMKGKWSGDKNPRHINPLEGSANGRWKGGVKTLKDYMRNQIDEWVNMSMEFCGYRSIVTGSWFKNIHHTTSFTDMLGWAVKNVNLDYRSSIGKYTTEELDKITKELQRLHEVYGYGACLEKDIHKLFHDTYSYITFTPENFLEFLHDIDNGKYNEWFESRNKVINLNREYLSYLEALCDSLRKVA